MDTDWEFFWSWIEMVYWRQHINRMDFLTHDFNKLTKAFQSLAKLLSIIIFFVFHCFSAILLSTVVCVCASFKLVGMMRLFTFRKEIVERKWANTIKRTHNGESQPKNALSLNNNRMLHENIHDSSNQTENQKIWTNDQRFSVTFIPWHKLTVT